MKKIKVLFWVGIVVGSVMAMGCAMTLETKVEKAGETGLNTIYASAARVRNPMGQEAIAIEIHAEAKTPPVAYRREVVTMNGNGAVAPAAAAKYAAPAVSPRGKKANIIVTPPPVKQAPPATPTIVESIIVTPPPVKQAPPATPTIVEREEGYYPSTIPLASAGGVGTGFLQDWGGKLIGAGGMVGSSAIMPGTDIVVGGAQAVVKGVSATGGKGGSAFQAQGQKSVNNNNNINALKNTNTGTNTNTNTNNATGTGTGTADATSN